MGFENRTNFVEQGESVSPGVTNRPTSQVDANVRYLYQLLQAQRIGQAIFALQQTIEAGALPGMPVWYNPVTQRYERALLQLFTDPISGRLVGSPSSQVWGVVYQKSNATLADLLLFGFAPLDISQALDGAPVAAGTYYLSGTTPGGLAAGNPPVGVSVLLADGKGNVLVSPRPIEGLTNHTHLRFNLVCLPAGDTVPPPPGGHHSITNPDPSLPGWLPASSFGGKAPAGAFFGYNLAAEPSLAALWPPQPLAQAYLEVNRGDEDIIGFRGVPLGHDGLAVLDANGIWWMTDCHGQAPWETDLRVSESEVSPESFSEGCPFRPPFEMALWFTRPNFLADPATVTSLRSIDPRIVVQCASDGHPASTGDLVLLLNLAFSLGPAGTRGASVLKTFNGEQFLQGNVLEGLYPLSSNVALSSNLPTVPLDPSNPSGQQVYQGLVGVAVTSQPTLIVPVQLVRLENVTEEYLDNLMYLGFEPGVAGDYRAQLLIPDDLAITSPTLALRFRLLGRAAGTLPALTLTARRVPRPAAGLTTPLNLPDNTAEFSVALSTIATLTLGNQYVEAVSTPFAVAAGDSVFFTLSRSASDVYPAEVGVLQQLGIIQAGG